MDWQGLRLVLIYTSTLIFELNFILMLDRGGGGHALHCMCPSIVTITVCFRTKSGAQFSRAKNDINFDEGIETPLELAIKTK